MITRIRSSGKEVVRTIQSLLMEVPKDQKYYMSLGYMKNGGIVQWYGLFGRYNVRARLDQRLNDWTLKYWIKLYEFTG